MAGKHIELFLVDGKPGGLTTAEIAGWTGHVLSGPRADLGKLLAREEASRNGTYMLFGDDSEAINGTRCYIGRTEKFHDRFKQHDAKKDWWDRAILISCRDDSFNEGHWGYLEHRLVQLATEAERVTLENGNSPQPRKLSEAQRSDMESFIDQLRVILPVLGINALRKVSPATTQPVQVNDDSPVFSLRAKNGIFARAKVDGDEFIVLEGSTCIAGWTATGKSESTRRSYAGFKATHDKLVADGTIVARRDGLGELTRDVPFPSPSRAGAIMLGRSCNGLTSWLYDGGTYSDWVNRGVAE